VVEGAMLVANRAGGDAHRPIVEGAEQGIGLDRQARRGKLLREAPALAAGADRPFVVERLGVDIAAGLAPAGDRYDLGTS